jgi:uroporphyrinogen decarboxylase
MRKVGRDRMAARERIEASLAGHLQSVLDDLRAAGIDGLSPLEPLSRMYAGDIWGMQPGWVLMGGIDASHLLAFGTEDDVRAAVRATLRDAAAEGRLWLGSSTEIHPAIPAANVLAMWDEALRCGCYDGASPGGGACW